MPTAAARRFTTTAPAFPRLYRHSCQIGAGPSTISLSTHVLASDASRKRRHTRSGTFPLLGRRLAHPPHHSQSLEHADLRLLFVFARIADTPITRRRSGSDLYTREKASPARAFSQLLVFRTWNLHHTQSSCVPTSGTCDAVDDAPPWCSGPHKAFGAVWATRSDFRLQRRNTEEHRR